jgi:hypothetical protein
MDTGVLNEFENRQLLFFRADAGAVKASSRLRDRDLNLPPFYIIFRINCYCHH